MTRTLAAIAVSAVALSALAGCGSDNGSSSGGAYGSGGGATTTKPASAEPSQGAAVVSVATVPKLGKVIVDSKGFTLYDFDKDKGTESSCYGPCAKVWPPLTGTGKPQASNGAAASMLGTTTRKDGTVQVTYAGHPLYTYTADTEPGEANGNDISLYGGEWYALQPNGEEPGA